MIFSQAGTQGDFSPVFVYIFYHIILNINIRSRAGMAQIKAQGDASRGVESYDSYDSASDASMKREKFLSTWALEVKGSLDP